VLSGKYLGGANPPGARLTLWDRFSRYKGEVPEAAIAAYVGVARKYGLDPAQLALAYVNEQPFVTSNIIGATSLEQLATNIASVDVRLPRAVDEIEAIHAAFPTPAPDHRQLPRPEPARRAFRGPSGSRYAQPCNALRRALQSTQKSLVQVRGA
jgi:hypothetical protein